MRSAAFVCILGVALAVGTDASCLLPPASPCSTNAYNYGLGETSGQSVVLDVQPLGRPQPLVIGAAPEGIPTYFGGARYGEQFVGAAPSVVVAPRSAIIPCDNYPVPSGPTPPCAVPSCGPEPCLNPIKTLKPLILTPVNSPIYPLPAGPAPQPQVIANKCHCTKTVLKPQLYQRLIQVQKNQRFLKKSYRPVVDKVAYCARPRC